MSNHEQPSFVIVGAGAIGTFVGLVLDNAGFQVRFLQRRSETATAQRQFLASNGLVGLCSTDPGFRTEIPAERILDVFTTDPSCLKECSYVLVTTKRTANAVVVKQLLDNGVTCPVLFLQNGLFIRKDFGEVPFEVVETVVPFNVVYDGSNGTSTLPQVIDDAKLVLDGKQPSAGKLAQLLSGLPIGISAADPLLEVQAGKLMLNMTNAVNALSGLAILPMYMQPSYRAVLAECIKEAQRIYAAVGIRPRGMTAQENSQLKFIVQLLLAPEWLFVAIVGRKLKGRGDGRTSMAQDLDAKRVPTEIEFLNGELVRMGEKCGVPTPVNRALITLVREAERKNVGCPGYSGEELMNATGVQYSGAVGRAALNCFAALIVALSASAAVAGCKPLISML